MARRRLGLEFDHAEEIWPPMPPIPDGPPVPSDPEDSVPIQIHNKSHHPPAVLISAAAAVAAFLLFSVAALVLFYVRRRRRLQQQQQQQLLQQQHPFVAPPPIPNLDDGFFNDDNLGQQHHVWLIKTVGLDEATIRAISAWPYKTGEGLIDDTDCAVCLGEFKDGELLKLLPKCSHAFHAPCIDTWLKSHVNCPLCRAPIVALKVNPALSSSSSSAFPVNGSGTTGGSSSNATVHPVDQDSQSFADLENTQPTFQTLEAERGILDGNEEELGVENRIRIVVDPLGISLDENFGSTVPGNLEESGLQPVRRSISMDSLPLGVLLLREDAAESSAEERKELGFSEETVAKNKGKHSNIPKGKKGVIGMERSLSSSGRWRFLSRHGRVARSSSILPL